MPLTSPPIDPRGYRELLAESLARVRVHTPEWTNFNDSDPGVTLLQLFAFIGENLAYRANQIPARNKLKFLQLLGVPLRPASAATGIVTIVNDRAPLEPIVLARGLPLLAGNVGFVTTTAVEVLPIESRVYYRRRLSVAETVSARRTYDQLFSAFTADSATLEYYETVEFTARPGAAGADAVSLADDTVDRSLWIALLARPGEQGRRRDIAVMLSGRTLSIGMMPALTSDSRVLPPRGAAPPDAPPPLRFAVSTGTFANAEPRYETLQSILDDSNPFENLTVAQVTLPGAELIGSWDDPEPLDAGVGDQPPLIDDPVLRARVVAWLRVQLPEQEGSADTTTWTARYSWIGVNAARVSQRVQVVGENAGKGTGEPDQRVTLVNTPVIPDTVEIFVNGVRWTRIDDLQAAPAEVDVRDPSLPPGGRPSVAGSPERFAVDGESGVVAFGDGLHGKRPPNGAVILASYAYGGTAAGNVGVGQIRVAPLLPAGFTVANPLPTWGGAAGETVEEGERDIPRYLRHRDRAVSAADFTDIVRQTPGVAIGRVDVRPLFHPEIGTPAPGVVTILLVPNDPLNPEAPVPNRLFLQAVCNHLEPRRLLTTEIHLAGPEYKPVWVSIGIDVVAGQEIAPVREGVKAAIRDFLSPLRGGFGQTGWPLDTPVDDRELWARAARVDGVARVRSLRLFDGTGTAVDRVEISGLQLPKLLRIAVGVGDAEDLAPPVVTTTAPRRVPVPVLPPTC